ncbi:MAG: hypothetical protein EPN88_18035 [Bacteroidetes bacterium]|nr:MAG: hypothetical protein EPN88_18035 [Bacteroidota bacterium]
MKRTRVDNTVSVIQRAVKHFRIPVTKSSVKEALKSNSYYPSFKSICDTLNEWNVEHYPLRYKPEEIKELAAPYIVHFSSGGGQLAFVSKIRNDRVTYYESYNLKRETEFKEFLERCSGAVILLNPDERSGEKGYRKKRQDELISNGIFQVSILAFLLFIILAVINSFVTSGMLLQKMKGLLFLTKATGIALSVLLILHEFEVHLLLTEKLCHLNKATNCNTVLNDKASKIFGWFGWADAGFIYFTGCLLFLLQDSEAGDYSLMAILSALSLPYPVFSVYYQGFVLKKWCPMCLGVQLILIIEFILMLPQFSNLNFLFISLSSLILTFLVTGIIYSLINMYIREKMSNEIHYYKYLEFKKNPDVLRTLLLNQKPYNIPFTEASLVFGEKDASMKITAFLSLQCSHCTRAFDKIKEMLKSEIKTGINIVIITSDNKILNALYHFSRLNKDDEALDLLDQWFKADPYSRNKISETVCIPDVNDISREVSNENLSLYKAYNVIGTPTFFINGYLLPNQYDIDDIKYFSEVFARKEVNVE